MYGRRWRKARLLYLPIPPLGVYCERDGQTRSATVVDHVEPHRGDLTLFWDERNWQALCQVHHDSTKQRMEKSGKAVGCDVEGNPLVRLDHW